MNPRAKFGLAALLLGLVVLGVWLFGELTEPQPVEIVHIAGVPVAAPKAKVRAIETPPLAETDTPEPEPKEEPEPAIAAEETAPNSLDEEPEYVVDELEHGRFQFELEVQVLGRLGRPLAESYVVLGPELHPTNLVGQVGGDGKLKLKWTAHVPSMKVVLAVCGPKKTWSGLRRFDCMANRFEQVQLALPGEQFATQKLKPKKTNSYRLPNQQKAQPVPGQFFDSPKAVRTGEFVQFVWAASDADQRDALSGLGSVSSRRGNRGRASGESMESFALKLVTDDSKAETISVTGRLLDSFLEPAAGALVTYGYSEEAPLYGAMCDSEGEFIIHDVKPSSGYIWGGGGEFGEMRVPKTVGVGFSDVGEVVLDRGTEMDGELFSIEKRPLNNWVVECVGDGLNRLETKFGQTDRNGRFRIPNLPSSKLRLHLRPNDSFQILPIQSIAVESRHLFQSLVAKNGSASPVATSVTAVRDEDLDGIEVRLWKENRGNWQKRYQRGLLWTAGLPNGFYEVTAFSQAGGWARKQSLVLGEVKDANQIHLKLSGGGTVRFVGKQDKQRSYVLWLKGPIIDSRVASSKIRVPRKMNLPAGEYQLEITSGSKRLPNLSFTVLSNCEMKVRVPR